MDILLRAVVLLLVATTVISIPFINDLKEGQKWPGCGQVLQPYQLAEEEAKGLDPLARRGRIRCPINQNLKQPFEGKPAKVPKPTVVEEKTEKNIVLDKPVEVELKDDAVAIIPKAATRRAREIEAKANYTGAQVWKVSTAKSGVRVTISRLKRRNLVSTWGSNQTFIDVFVKQEAINNVTRIFKRENISYNVIIEDLQKRIEEENPPLDANELVLQNRRARVYNIWRYRAFRRRLSILGAYMGYNSLDLPMEYWPSANWGHRMTWKQYHRLDDIYGFMSYLAKTYPAVVSVQNIGTSYEGRDIKLLKISNGKENNKAIFIDGGIHAREWISPATVTYFINLIVEKYDGESDDIKNIDWYFVPVVNPDGYEYTHQVDRLWRKNRRPAGGARGCIGTDLNRNFGYHWGGKGASRNPCYETYCGSTAFSEPESKAISDFIKNNSGKFSAYVTYHSYGQYLLYPWGYDNFVPPDYQDLDNLGKKIASAIENSGGSRYSVGSSSGLLYPASGGSDDWAKSEGIKYSFTIELSDTGRYGFILPTQFIEPVAKESLAGLRVLASNLS